MGELSVNTLAANNDVEDNTWSVLIASEGGLVTAAPNEGLRISSSGQVVVGQEGMRFEGVLDLTGVEVRGFVDSYVLKTRNLNWLLSFKSSRCVTRGGGDGEISFNHPSNNIVKSYSAAALPCLKSKIN